MKARLNNDELLRFADSYLREAFPNPDRTGCPADEQLRDLAEAPNPTNEEASGPDRLGGRYVDPAKSNLTAKIEPRPNELPPIRLP